MALQLLGVLIAGGAVGTWAAVYGLCLLATRPIRPEPLPPTQDLGRNPEPPAVVSLLANYWEITVDAGESTLLDLGARKVLEFRQPADDARQTTVHVRQPNPSGLNAYEQRVFHRVAGLAVGGVVPLTALTFRDEAKATGFAKQLRAEVIADARARGLSRRRFGPAVLAVLTVTALLAAFGMVAAALVGLRMNKDTGWTLLMVWIISFTLLSSIGGRNVGERDTPRGQQVAAHWLGVKAWLHNTGTFGDLPPAAVAVWDRYLAYGAAVGATRVSSEVIDLGMGNRRRVWSSYGGSWHRVRVHYPRFWLRYGRPAPPVIIKALVAGGFGALLLYGWTREIARLADPVRLAALLLGLVLGAYGGYLLVRMIIDLAAPASITGQVLWKQVWRSNPGGENSPPVPWLYYLAVDDGTGDRTRAWGLPSGLAGRCEDGDTVTVVVRRWTRRIGEVTVVERGSLRQVEAQDANTDKTENLIAAAMGIPAAVTSRTPATSAALLTVDEVSRAMGFAVTDRSPGAQPFGTVHVYLGPDGAQVMMMLVSAGLPGQLAIRSRRRFPSLPGIGDEAYTGDGWALGRRGDTVIMLNLHGPGRRANPNNIFWLLSTAVGRLPASAQPVG
jgi:hypothetical protein